MIAFDLPHWNGARRGDAPHVVHLAARPRPRARLPAARAGAAPRAARRARDRDRRGAGRGVRDAGPERPRARPALTRSPSTATPRRGGAWSAPGVDVVVYRGDEISRKGDGGPTCLTRRCCALRRPEAALRYSSSDSCTVRTRARRRRRRRVAALPAGRGARGRAGAQATLADHAPASSTAAGSVVERVRIEKSAVAQLRGHRPAGEARVPQALGDELRPGAAPPSWSAARSETSRANVSSAETRPARRSSSRSRGSMPRARSRSSGPSEPGRSARRSGSESAASAPIVVDARGSAAASSARGPTPGSRRTRAARGTVLRFPGGTTVMPPGLRRSDAILHTTFEVPTPSEQVRLVVARDRGLDRRRDRARTREVGRDRAEVEVALVDPGALDPRDDLADRVPDGPRVLAIERVPGAHEDGGRAASERLGRAHRGVDAELPRDVVRGRDDAAAVRVAADDERLLAQLGVLELLDRGEERVEIEVREDRHRGKATVASCSEPSPSHAQASPTPVARSRRLAENSDLARIAATLGWP